MLRYLSKDKRCGRYTRSNLFGMSTCSKKFLLSLAKHKASINRNKYPSRSAASPKVQPINSPPHTHFSRLQGGPHSLQVMDRVRSAFLRPTTHETTNTGCSDYPDESRAAVNSNGESVSSNAACFMLLPLAAELFSCRQ